MISDFFSIGYLLSISHGAFLIFVLFIRNWKKIGANTFLIVLIVIITGYLAREYLYLQGRFDDFPHLMAVFVPLLYFIGPLYFFYIALSIRKNFQFRPKHLLHAVPSLVCFLTILPFYLLTGEEKLSMFNAPGPGNLELNSNRIFYYGLMLISWTYYGIEAFRLISSKEHSQDMRNLKPHRHKFVWLKRYTEVFLFISLLFFIVQLIFIFTDLYPYYFMLGIVLASSLLIHFVGYWALKESRITGAESSSPGLNLSKNRMEAYKGQLVSLMENEKTYADGQLAIDDLAEMLSTNSKYLSYLINKEFKCSVTHFINSYRIEAAKKMIKDSNYDHLNFLGIAAGVGFNTKNTFTRAFKRHTGMTPSQFKDEIDTQIQTNS